MKGIKFFGVLAAASLLFSVNAFAQENANRDENGKIVRGAYETNKAFDNTFIEIGGGVNAVCTPILDPKGWGNIGIGAELNFGKWWTPAIGMRFGWRGITNAAKEGFTAPATNPGEKFGFNFFHGDMMWNISNSIGGYKETRFWDFIPYLTTGALNLSKEVFSFKGNWEFAAGVGLVNNLRLGKRVDLNLDLSVLISREQAYHPKNRFVAFPSAMIGLAFNLGKPGFDRHSSITPVVIPVPFTTDQYNALADKVAALEKENAALKDKIAALEKELEPYKNLVNGQTYLYENGTFTAVDVTPSTPMAVYFNLGSSKLSDREKAHIDYFAKNVVNGDTKLAINGYADKQTGSAKRNQTLSEQRVKSVVDYLTKAGANADNIETAAHGATVQPFDTPAKNRVVTIEVK